MNALIDVLPLLVVGVSFSTLGALKVYGRAKGIIGGGGTPASSRLTGSCPTWSRSMNTVAMWLLCGIGVAALAAAILTLLRR